ncbi:hypothetical protein PCK1_001385 [Pneumocystis canis]|nr:hypothetical protein PCK1_001385 [Pneumocystis canis]
MKISIIHILIAITGVLSRDKFINEKYNALDNTKSLASDYTNSYRTYEQRSLLERIDKNLQDAKTLNSILSKNFYLKNRNSKHLSLSNGNNGINDVSISNKDASLEEDYRFFTMLLSAYFNNKYTSIDCEKLLEQYCKYADYLKGVDSRLKNMPLLCTNQTQTCQKALDLLTVICYEAEELQVKINTLTDDLCLKEALICKYLGKVCGQKLETICKEIKDKCKKPDETTSAIPTTSAHEWDGYITNTHTIIVAETAYVTETSFHTYIDVTYKTVDCSSDDIEYCVCTPNMPLCSESTYEPEPTEDSTKESIDQEECTITTILTVENSNTVTTTITITSASENANKTDIQEKNNGLRINGFQISGIIEEDISESFPYDIGDISVSGITKNINNEALSQKKSNNYHNSFKTSPKLKNTPLQFKHIHQNNHKENENFIDLKNNDENKSHLEKKTIVKNIFIRNKKYTEFKWKYKFPLAILPEIKHGVEEKIFTLENNYLSKKNEIADKTHFEASGELLSKNKTIKEENKKSSSCYGQYGSLTHNSLGFFISKEYDIQ